MRFLTVDEVIFLHDKVLAVTGDRRHHCKLSGASLGREVSDSEIYADILRNFPAGRDVVLREEINYG